MSDKNITVDESAVDLGLPPEPSKTEEPTQVETLDVVFVPKKDFDARVNDQIFYFRKDVPTRVTRPIANMLLEDPDRGYVRD